MSTEWKKRKTGTARQRGKAFPVGPSKGEKYEGRSMEVYKVERVSQSDIQNNLSTAMKVYEDMMKNDAAFRHRALKHRLDAIAEKFGLDPYEKDELRRIVQEEEEERFILENPKPVEPTPIVSSEENTGIESESIDYLIQSAKSSNQEESTRALQVLQREHPDIYESLLMGTYGDEKS